MKRNVIVGQSGGPTAVINASLYGVVYEALNREDACGKTWRMKCIRNCLRSLHSTGSVISSTSAEMIQWIQ